MIILSPSANYILKNKMVKVFKIERMNHLSRDKITKFVHILCQYKFGYPFL